MKRYAAGVGLLLVLGWTGARLVERWREEKMDRSVTLMADVSEVREAALRQNLSPSDLFGKLKNAGLNAVLVSPSTIQDFLWSDFTFTNRAAAEAVLHQLQDRNVSGVSLDVHGAVFHLRAPSIGWARLKEVEVGFDPVLLGQASQAGLSLVLRVNQDPWISKENMLADLQAIQNAHRDLGIVLNTDDIPGGSEALAEWSAFLERRDNAQLLFEFHPTKSSAKLARRSPQSTYRAHTIPSAELKDLLQAQQLSRWTRAVEERSCRFLLLHLSPSDSLGSFLDSVAPLRDELLQKGWSIAWPKPHTTWGSVTWMQRTVAPLLALLLAIGVPIVALKGSLSAKPSVGFARQFVVTFVGACVMAAVAGTPWTRLEIAPFRGIKMAFLLSWIGSFSILYSWRDLSEALTKNVRRWDVVVGCLVLGALGYLVLRTGNAGAGWKAGGEQVLRDHLEQWLVARPRFKEFAIGYPFLWVGLHWRSVSARRKLGQFLTGVGMIGPISMVNTFCHLHSPLYLALWRSLNGVILGSLLGLGLLWVLNKGMDRADH